jgi:hypothetical protein
MTLDLKIPDIPNSTILFSEKIFVGYVGRMDRKD